MELLINTHDHNPYPLPYDAGWFFTARAQLSLLGDAMVASQTTGDQAKAENYLDSIR